MAASCTASSGSPPPRVHSPSSMTMTGNPYHPKNADYNTVTSISPISVFPSSYGLDNHGLGNLHLEHWNLPTAALYEQAVQNGEAQLVHSGPLVVRTGKHTGRAAGDKFFVDEPSSNGNIAWGDVNQRMSQDHWNALEAKSQAYLQNRTVYVNDVVAGADPKHCLKVRIITETAWHALFVRNMFIRPVDSELPNFIPEFTLIHTPSMMANPKTEGTNSGTFICLHLGVNKALIGGTFYAGEVKKCIFTVMNYKLPLKGVLSMHSSANVDPSTGKSSVFFGLSGTGKTTLSADASRQLIGDDEHGWSDDGIFNIEAGCYAKIIRLNPVAEATIFETTRRFGTILENVYMDPVTRQLDLGDNSLTENTRASYPLSFIPNIREGSVGPLPSSVVFLTCDAFGVVPPISKLTPAQAEYYFLCGYTAKVAGTEMGVTTPTATFSPCFGLPFMPLHPTKYSKLLRKKITEQNVDVWLLNTGWTGGAYGTGKRMSIHATRTLLNDALDGKLSTVAYKTHDIFQLSMPVSAPGVSSEILDPVRTWKNADEYNKQANDLARLFAQAFEGHAALASEDVRQAGPVVQN